MKPGAKRDRQPATSPRCPLCKCGCGQHTKSTRFEFLHNHFWTWKKANDPTFGAIMRDKRPTYNIWYGIIDRCTNPTFKHWHRYGGRGIKVCERWRVFDNFFADMGPRPPGLEIDRINNDGNYEPGNCRWTDRKTQRRNSSTVRLITYKGETRCLRDWEPLLGLYQNTLRMRLKRHPFEEVFANYKPNA